MLRSSSLLTAALLLGLLLGACVPQTTLPTDCDAASVSREATLTAGALDPEGIAVCKGQQVTLAITVDETGVLHLHGYDEAVPATAVEAGDTASLSFTAGVAGQFVIEFHGEEGDAEIGIFTVHDR